MVQNLHFMMRSGYAKELAIVRALPPQDAVLLRHAALLLTAHDLLATFHRAPTATAIDVKVDYSPETADDRYEVSARNGFYEVHGDTRPPHEHALVDENLPLELMSSGSFTLQRDNPLVELSLSDTKGRDRHLHHRLVHQLAVEIDSSIDTPPLI